MAKKSANAKTRAAPTLAITDLIGRATLQALQEQFSDRHRVATAILDPEAMPITFERGQVPYCREIRKTEAGYSRCRHCERELIADVLRTRRSCWAVCDHGGLLDFATPLKVSGETRGFFFVGQIRGRRGKMGTDGLATTLGFLHSLAANSGEGEDLSDDVLRKKFAPIRVRTPQEIADLERAAVDFAKDLGSVLTKLDRWERPQVVAGFVSRIVQATDVDELFDICVAKIPRLLGTEHCSVFTVVRGSTKASERLILRRTSYGPNRRREGRTAYKMGEGLTGWVWKNRRPLRLSSIQNKEEISRYWGLRWSRRIDDSDQHREWLGVPLFGQHKEVIGVIRVPQKKRTGRAGAGGFTFEDEILLLSIGRQVARQIEELQTREQARIALPACLDCAVELAQVTDSQTVPTVVLAACKRVWGTTERSHFFHLLDDDGRTLRIEKVVGVAARRKIRGREVPLDSSLPGVCLSRGRAVITHDVQRIERRSQDSHTVEGIDCGMSAPIRFGKKTFGTLSVGGNRRFEFSTEPDLRILRELASLAGASLARLEAQREAERAIAEFSSRAGHTLVNRIATIEARTAVLKAKTRTKYVTDIQALEDATEFLKSVAGHALRFGRAWHDAQFCSFELASKIESLQQMYQDPRLVWRFRGRLAMMGNPELIRQLLEELINNALDFAPRENGPVIVRAFRPPASGRGQKARRMVVVEVEDNGPGVPPEDKESIFLPYQSDREAHLGLGLSIVKRIAEVHGGYASERGSWGRGACFRVVVPQERRRK